MKRLALKVDVDTFRGTREGVPRLVEMLRRHGARASFLFSLGRDHTGRAIRRALRPGFLRKVSRTSVLSHYGLRTLLYGTLLPGPDIGRRCAGVLRSVRDAGFEVGIHCHDHVKWQNAVEHADAAWTLREMRRAMQRFEQVMGEPAHVHGAAGWQMNRTAVRLTQRLGFHYCSDCRGSHPFVPVIDAEIIGCAQLPTTLPTLDELIGREGITAEDVHETLLAATRNAPRRGHVYTLHAELEGMKLAPVLERLIEGWRAQGYALVTLGELFESLAPDALPRHELVRGEVPGRAGSLMMQGPEFLAGE